MFEVDGTKSLDRNAIKFCDEGVNFVGRTFENNGIQGKIEKREFEPNEAFTITATVIGNYKYVKYQIEPYYCSQNVNKLKPKPIIEIWNKNIAYFLVTNIQKFVSLYDYQQSGYKLEDIKKHKVNLPTKNGKIDFEFMESFIAELEAQRIAELEAYLTVTGLKDYELTEKEKNVLLMFENIKLKEYEIGDLFEIRPTKAYRYTNSDLFDKSGKYPVVTNSSNSNGITGYTNLTPTENGNIITYSDTTTSEGIFYQPRNFVGYSHIQGLYPFIFKDKWNCYTLLYIVSTFRKSAAGRFDYGNKFNRKFAKKLKISLPVKNDGIDFEFMETLIRAVQKLVIKDVVCWADKKIEATKLVIKNNKN